jgi:hypothetical protein
MHECMCIFCGMNECILTGVVITKQVQLCTLDKCCEHQRMRTLVDWRGGLFLTEGEIGVLFVSSLFLPREGVYVGVGACTHIHTHIAHMGYSDVSPGDGMRHLNGPKNSDGLNLSIYILAYVYKAYIY